MSFSSSSSGTTMKNFVSEDELDEKRKKRQEEWEKVRKPDQPIECPEEVIDNRTLFDRLQAQKDIKDEEYAEQHRLSSMVKGLDEDEAKFLEGVSEQQTKILRDRHEEESRLLQELQEAAVEKIDESKTSNKSSDIMKSTRPQSTTSQNKKSQSALLAGAVKRKSTSTADPSSDEKKQKQNEGNAASAVEDDVNKDDSPAEADNPNYSVARIIGILPGIGAYTNDTSDSASSSSDSDDIDIVPVKAMHVGRIIMIRDH